MISTILGSIFGGIFRMAPEILKWLDRKDERAHEYRMLDKQSEMDAARSKQALGQIAAQGDITLSAAGLDALKEAIKGQDQITGVGWVDAFSKSVRPFLTYWWAVVLSTTAMACEFILLHQAGVPSVQAIAQMWGEPEKALVASLFTFWFLDRTITKRPQ